MRKRVCVISGAGAYDKKDIKNMRNYLKLNDIDLGGQKREVLYIAADGGFSLFQKEGFRTDVRIGDFDSSLFDDDSVTCEKIKLPIEKDDTDMLAAIKLGLERDYEEFHILGGTGKRFEHTIANMQCLSFLLNHQTHGFMYGENRIITMIKNESFFITKKNHNDDMKYISLFAYSDVVEGVNLEGFKYPLIDATLKKEYPIGISNELIESKGAVHVKNGELLIVF